MCINSREKREDVWLNIALMSCRYFPRNFGFRFSMNALRPSL